MNKTRITINTETNFENEETSLKISSYRNKTTSCFIFTVNLKCVPKIGIKSITSTKCGQ